MHDIGEWVDKHLNAADMVEETLRAEDEDFVIPKNMPWKRWADWAYTNRVALLNWAPNTPIPSKGFKDFKNGFSAAALEVMVRLRDRQAGVAKSVDEEDEDAGARIVRWTEGLFLSIGDYNSFWLAEEKESALVDMADIPLITDSNGVVLVSVKDSKIYLVDVAVHRLPDKDGYRQEKTGHQHHPHPGSHSRPHRSRSRSHTRSWSRFRSHSRSRSPKRVLSLGPEHVLSPFLTLIMNMIVTIVARLLLHLIHILDMVKNVVLSLIHSPIIMKVGIKAGITGALGTSTMNQHTSTLEVSRGELNCTPFK